jgi:hypothetical protein
MKYVENRREVLGISTGKAEIKSSECVESKFEEPSRSEDKRSDLGEGLREESASWGRNFPG